MNVVVINIQQSTTTVQSSEFKLWCQFLKPSKVIFLTVIQHLLCFTFTFLGSTDCFYLMKYK
jgi:hypothetical protein